MCYATHLLEENLQFNVEFDISHIQEKYLNLKFLETLEINKLKNSVLVLKDQLDLNNSLLFNLFSGR